MDAFTKTLFAGINSTPFYQYIYFIDATFATHARETRPVSQHCLRTLRIGRVIIKENLWSQKTGVVLYPTFQKNCLHCKYCVTCIQKKIVINIDRTLAFILRDIFCFFFKSN